MNERTLGGIAGNEISGESYTGSSHADCNEFALIVDGRIKEIEGYLLELSKVVAARAGKHIEYAILG